MLEELKELVCKQNKALKEHGLVTLTWGNVSALDRDSGLVVIKPSGVGYGDMSPKDMVVVDLNGEVIEGCLRPSSDTPTHLYLYRAFHDIGGIVHTHSTFATAWAQSGQDIPVYGTTHADAFYGDIPCTRSLTDGEVCGDYELNTGRVIAESFSDRDYAATPAVLVRSHAPFVWGRTCREAVENAVTLEEIAKMAYITRGINPYVKKTDGYLINKHYQRKHGKDAYYGQKKGE